MHSIVFSESESFHASLYTLANTKTSVHKLVLSGHHFEKDTDLRRTPFLTRTLHVKLVLFLVVQTLFSTALRTQSTILAFVF